MESRKALLDVT